MRKYIFIIIFITFITNISGQEKIDNIVEFDKLIHDFGDVLLSEKDLKCDFTLKNISKKPIVIYSIIESCGCTNVESTKKPIMPGKTSTISVNYSNDDGPYPFNKTLTLYISGITNPIVLRIRGIAYEEEKPLEEKYPLNFGPLAMRENILKCGNISQGRRRSDEIMVANTATKPINVDFSIESPGLSFILEPNPIPARSNARLVFTVDAQANVWGKNYYYAKPIINGVKYDLTGTSNETKPDSYIGDLNKNKNKIAVFAFTKENFDNISKEEKERASKPMFKTSTFSFGKINSGDNINAKFEFKNTGKSDFIIHKVDVDIPNATITPLPATKAGKSKEFTVSFNSDSLPKGEALVIITLTTNSPMRPIINLFAIGWIL